jgi:hypothetical protein
MTLGETTVLPDPREMWSEVLSHSDDDYNMLGLIRELKTQYGITWIGFEHSTAERNSIYKIIDEKKFGYFVIRHSDLIKDF